MPFQENKNLENIYKLIRKHNSTQNLQVPSKTTNSLASIKTQRKSELANIFKLRDQKKQSDQMASCNQQKFRLSQQSISNDTQPLQQKLMKSSLYSFVNVHPDIVKKKLDQYIDPIPQNVQDIINNFQEEVLEIKQLKDTDEFDEFYQQIQQYEKIKYGGQDFMLPDQEYFKNYNQNEFFDIKPNQPFPLISKIARFQDKIRISKAHLLAHPDNKKEVFHLGENLKKIELISQKVDKNYALLAQKQKQTKLKEIHDQQQKLINKQIIQNQKQQLLQKASSYIKNNNDVINENNFKNFSKSFTNEDLTAIGIISIKEKRECGNKQATQSKLNIINNKNMKLRKGFIQ